MVSVGLEIVKVVVEVGQIWEGMSEEEMWVGWMDIRGGPFLGGLGGEESGSGQAVE